MALSKAEILRSSRERDKRKRRVAKFFGLFVSLFIVALFLIVVNLSFLRVTNLEVAGQTNADKLAIEQFIDSQLTGRYLGLVPKNSIFFVYKGSLSKKILNEFPGLVKVTITWPNLNTLAILVADREFKVLWCEAELVKKKCYYLSLAGVAYQPAPNFSKSFYIELYGQVPLKELNSQVIKQEDLLRATAFLNFVKSSSFLWPTGDIILQKAEVYAHRDFIATLVKTSDPTWRGLILFNTDQSANNLITNYNSILKNDTFQEDWQTGAGRLEYLDLRFPGKVFYRFK